MNPKSEALKQSDGSFVVRVFHAHDRSTDVVFPYTPEAPLLAIEYADFKNAQREKGKQSLATQAILREAAKDQDPGNAHDQLMAKADLKPVPKAPQAVLSPIPAPAPKAEVIKVPVPAGDTNLEVKELEKETEKLEAETPKE